MRAQGRQPLLWIGILTMTNVALALTNGKASATDGFKGICRPIAQTEACYCSPNLGYDCNDKDDCYNTYPELCTIIWP